MSLEYQALPRGPSICDGAQTEGGSVEKGAIVWATSFMSQLGLFDKGWLSDGPYLNSLLQVSLGSNAFLHVVEALSLFLANRSKGQFPPFSCFESEMPPFVGFR